MKIYIVVKVEYDWFRFQDNLFASIDKKECIEWAKKYANDKDNYTWEDEKLPIAKTKNQNKRLEGKGKNHLWIQEF